MTRVKLLAIVGSVKVPNELYVRDWMAEKIQEYGTPDTLHIISGGAKGVDTIAASVADEMGYTVYEIVPKVRRWGGPNGFQARNAVIAERCDSLVRLAHYASTTHGSGWTRDYANYLHKPTHSFRYEASGRIQSWLDDFTDRGSAPEALVKFAEARSRQRREREEAEA